jgi:prepilin-type N-terminal cleavage/methylation domain-containing protein
MKGFTLAEVLITLLIIGVIASIVIPGLINDTQQAEFKTAYKKAFADANNALRLAAGENGGGFGPVGCSGDAKYNAIKSKLNVVKECPGNSIGNCWAAGGVTPFTAAGSHGCAASGWDLAGQNSMKSFVTSNGMFWLDWNGCDIMAVDVNGNKGPNQWGKDVFSFTLGDNSLTGMGACTESTWNAASTVSGGNALNYLMQ